jgi:hypothetical protein
MRRCLLPILAAVLLVAGCSPRSAPRAAASPSPSPSPPHVYWVTYGVQVRAEPGVLWYQVLYTRADGLNDTAGPDHNQPWGTAVKIPASVKEVHLEVSAGANSRIDCRIDIDGRLASEAFAQQAKCRLSVNFADLPSPSPS